MDELALFPLNTVLFPGGTLPLHIFEERYKLMISECLERHSLFGVVLIRSGAEVGAPAEPYPVGTTARISRHRILDDGRINLVAVGVDRFRIDSVTQSRPYLRGAVEILEQTELDTSAAVARAEEVGNLYVEYYRLALALSSQWQDKVGLPQQPVALADFVATRIDAEPSLKQRLLETISVADRLGAERELLAESVELLAAQVKATRRLRYGGLGALN